MNERIEIRTLTDGGQEPVEVARAVAAFIDGAERTLDLAQYDFNLGEQTAAIVGDAIRRAAARGIRLRFMFNVDYANPVPVPPPPEPDVQLIATLPVEGKASAGIPDLMHHKFVIRDSSTVFTGSMNWTDDSWSRQENVIAIVHSEAIAKAYDLDFGQLWTTSDVEQTGFVDPRWEDNLVRAWFTPGHGEDLSARIAKMIRRAKKRVRICSPLITTGPVLGTLAQVIADGTVDVAGCVDATQVREVIQQWRANLNVSW
jgi:phosphatidylserine/phosphatidylglycerophosphate/cardiolipin synthase-like enzyme